MGIKVRPFLFQLYFGHAWTRIPIIRSNQNEEHSQIETPGIKMLWFLSDMQYIVSNIAIFLNWLFIVIVAA